MPRFHAIDGSKPWVASDKHSSEAMGSQLRPWHQPAEEHAP